MALKKLDVITYDVLMYSLKKKQGLWTCDNFRDFRKAQGVDKETVIPAQFIVGMLAYRKAEYDPADKGWKGKFSEVFERLTNKAMKGLSVQWVEFAAHKPGEVDLYYNARPVEKKTGGGDWLYSHKNHTSVAIVKEYSRKKGDHPSPCVLSVSVKMFSR